MICDYHNSDLRSVSWLPAKRLKLSWFAKSLEASHITQANQANQAKQKDKIFQLNNDHFDEEVDGDIDGAVDGIGEPVDEANAVQEVAVASH